MKRLEALIALTMGYVMSAVGAALEFGGYGVLGAGIVLMAALLFVDIDLEKK